MIYQTFFITDQKKSRIIKKCFNKNKFFNKCLKEYNNIMELKTARKLKSTGENESVFNEKDSIITFKKKLKK